MICDFVRFAFLSCSIATRLIAHCFHVLTFVNVLYLLFILLLLLLLLLFLTHQRQRFTCSSVFLCSTWHQKAKNHYPPDGFETRFVCRVFHVGHLRPASLCFEELCFMLAPPPGKVPFFHYQVATTEPWPS